ncbi:hypothetical protein ACFXPY_17405 [Streptomyces sp. NPDC059153]|uniref:hypothetical protein n=1 Tax=unclassified Streptomyces TaxID=2593676 RepID=UPI0036B66D67
MFTRLPIPQHRLGEDRISRWYAYDEIYIRELVGTASSTASERVATSRATSA